MKTFPRLAIYHGRENKEKNHRGEAVRHEASSGILALHARMAMECDPHLPGGHSVKLYA
jgi:hypothetical protein